uniref:F-box domain-containing protein n=1 Tax=Steinernema glaseri TaxID=37863 RepID=A0A1I7ZZ41_9BILA
MNGVPLAFWEHLCDITRTLSNARKLSGYYGDLAELEYRYSSYYQAFVSNGVESRRYLTHYSSNDYVYAPEEIEATPKKFVEFLMINLIDGHDESVSRELVQRFPYSKHQFAFSSKAISETSIDFMYSLKKIAALVITTQLDDESIRRLQKLVTGLKLFELLVYEPACQEGGLTGTLKSLLCQDQFQELAIRCYVKIPWRSGIVRELLHFWSEHAQEMRGKNLFFERCCEGGVDQLEEFILHRDASKSDLGIEEALEVCSQEECDFINWEYCHNNERYTKPSCVYKFEEGEGEQRRRLYISFECKHEEEGNTEIRWGPASCSGRDNLGLMRATELLHVLFA